MEEDPGRCRWDGMWRTKVVENAVVLEAIDACRDELKLTLAEFFTTTGLCDGPRALPGREDDR